MATGQARDSPNKIFLRRGVFGHGNGMTEEVVEGGVERENVSWEEFCKCKRDDCDIGILRQNYLLVNFN